ncbi:adenosylcobinamide-GDP ribazoletransferase [Desulfovibrio litoralis]|uniref:Adenosylcobinamide-GDP ribazoletransferase n=1 Tax=Desulfovibrio litoralis DSM 11393 TaxID=1121455 RepID=A0A1M7RRT2_9BACT|nr:adenosylcobinamide-GDP ribazoletransferase [Desulfovibrio litoralis]SHN48816.1 cobalamin-5'-phosphate synthase [Desulfovibrio litoralis DSM 11393]
MNKVLSFFACELRLFFTALTFLTRFYIKCSNKIEEIQDSVKYYPLVGLFIGFIGISLITGLTLITPLPNLFSAFLYVFWLYYITKALHWDGLADLTDACGVNKSKFYEVLKDSHIGAFGVLSLIFGIFAQILLLYTYLENTSFSTSYDHFFKTSLTLAFMPFWGRFCAILLAFISKSGFCAKPNSQSLGELCVNGVNKTNLYPTLLLAALLLFNTASSTMMFVLCLGTSLTLIKLSKISRDNKVFNGDFLGTSIICGETVYLFSLIFNQ